MNAKVSVIIPNYNYARFIGEAIESVLAQTYQPLEIIVVDDGSTDDSIKVIESFGDKIKLIRQENGGVGKARNTGARNSNGDFFAFLDADDIWLPEKIEKQTELFNNASIGYVSCGMSEFNLEGNIIGQYRPLATGWITENMVLFDINTVVSGSAIMVNKESFERIGGFDENPNLHPSEDWDFARRISEICPVNVTSEILVRYRNHGNNGHLNISRFERSVLLAFEKTFSNNSPEVRNLKKQAYGNLHKILAGSYLQSGQYFDFLRNLLWSLWFRPSFIGYYLSLVMHRKRKNS